MLILVPVKPVAILLGFLSAMIFCGYSISCWIEHKDPFKVGGATHISRSAATAHLASAHKHMYKPVAHVSQ
jgi:hypothetical protein